MKQQYVLTIKMIPTSFGHTVIISFKNQIAQRPQTTVFFKTLFWRTSTMFKFKLELNLKVSQNLDWAPKSRPKIDD